MAAALVSAYQYTLSPLKAALFGAHGCCRFHPTCSEYARQALLRHGVLRGSLLAAWRLCKCHPFHPGGEDAVPPLRPETCNRTITGHRMSAHSHPSTRQTHG